MVSSWSEFSKFFEKYFKKNYKDLIEFEKLTAKILTSFTLSYLLLLALFGFLAGEYEYVKVLLVFLLALLVFFILYITYLNKALDSKAGYPTVLHKSRMSRIYFMMEVIGKEENYRRKLLQKRFDKKLALRKFITVISIPFLLLFLFLFLVIAPRLLG